MENNEKIIIFHYLNIKIYTSYNSEEYVKLLLENLTNNTIIPDEIHAKNIFFHFMALRYREHSLGIIIRFHQNFYKIARDFLIKDNLHKSTCESEWIIGLNNNLCHTRCYKKFQRRIKIKDGKGIGIHRRCFKVIYDFEYTLHY